MKRKKLFQSVVERAGGQCEVCGGRGTEVHHIIFKSGLRRKLESKENLILLCMECHRGTRGIHGAKGRKLDLKLKKQVQEGYFKQGYSEDEVRELMGGRIY